MFQEDRKNFLPHFSILCIFPFLFTSPPLILSSCTVVCNTRGWLLYMSLSNQILPTAAKWLICPSPLHKSRPLLFSVSSSFHCHYSPKRTFFVRLLYLTKSMVKSIFPCSCIVRVLLYVELMNITQL